MVRPIVTHGTGEDDPYGQVARRTDGGSRGQVLRVTSLTSEGPSSLREALETPGPRLVIFEVGGVIDLRGQPLVVRHPHLTLAGQTAPDPGITIIRGSLIVEASDVVIEHIAVRPGDDGMTVDDWAPDAISIRRGSSGPVHDIELNHCSATWSVDENLSVSGPADVDTSNDSDATARDVTIRYCLIANALSHSTHPKGEHSKGTLIHDGVRNVVILGSVFANNRDRNPRLKGGTRVVVAGSVMYNWGSSCVGVGARGNRRLLEPAEGVLIDNVAIAGQDHLERHFVKSFDPGARMFLDGNVALSADGKPLPLVDEDVVALREVPEWAPSIPRQQTWEDTAARALRSAGARPARRDPIDARIIDSIVRGHGQIINSQHDAGGYPVREATRRTLDVPSDPEDRVRWLQQLSDELAVDRDLDLSGIKP